MARRQLHDRYFKQAKAEGYLARSAYKLQQINERKRVISPGGRVLDLGCAPGSWLQVASEIVGPRGAVVGLDLKPVAENGPNTFGPNIHPFQGDINAADTAALLRAAGLDPDQPRDRFDAVLSDMAPDTTGHGDHFASVRLCDRVLDLLPGLLRPGGHLVMKVFEGEAYMDLVRRTAARFREAKGYKPPASRDASFEMYIVALGYRGETRP